MGSPTYTPLVENRREGGFVVYDPSDGMFTRVPSILQAGSGICIAGLVLAGLLTGAAAVAAPLGVNTGNGAFGAVTVGTTAKQGAYVVEFNDPTNFMVQDPTGISIGHGKVGQAFAAGGIGFTIAVGATAFAPADSFTVLVTGTIKYVPWDPALIGAPVAILWSGWRDATAADKRCVVNVRGPMMVNASELLWGPNVTTLAQQAIALGQLQAAGIINA